VGFSSKFSYETLQFCDPVPKLSDFIHVGIVTDGGVIDLINTETGQAQLDTPRARSLSVALPLGSMTVKARLSGAVTPALAMVDVEV
jgi:hypothetical protein